MKVIFFLSFLFSLFAHPYWMRDFLLSVNLSQSSQTGDFHFYSHQSGCYRIQDGIGSALFAFFVASLAQLEPAECSMVMRVPGSCDLPKSMNGAH